MREREKNCRYSIKSKLAGRQLEGYALTGSISDKPKPGRPSVLTIEHFIDAAIERNDEFMMVGLQ